VSPRPYLTSLQLNELRATLTTNEWAVLEDVAVMRLAVASDLQTLQGLRSPLSVRQFRRLLAGLDERGVLFRLERTVGGRARGSAGFVYAIGASGHRLRTDDGKPGPRPWTPRPSWMKHALAVGRLFVVLRALEERNRLQRVNFEAEPSAWRVFNDGGETVTLKPDAVVVADHDDFRDSYFVEVDCATESPATIARKCDVYRRYWRCGDEQRTTGVFPQVLWLVPSDRRRDVIAKVIAALREAKELHSVARYDQAASVFGDEEPP
jgi:hypothetical protein